MRSEKTEIRFTPLFRRCARLRLTRVLLSKGMHSAPPRGFTLVEVLASLVVTALIVATIAGSTRTIARARERTQERVLRDQSARRALDAVVGALRQVRRDRVEDKPTVIGTPGRPGEGDRIDMLVVNDSIIREDAAESDQQEVGFMLVTREGQMLPSLVRRRDHALDEHVNDGGIATVVAEGIVDLHFEYMTDNRWEQSWPETEPRGLQAVRVRIAAMSPPREGARPSEETTVLSTVVAVQVPPKPEERNQERPGGGR